MLHAFVIDALDTHSCQMSEYVNDFTQNPNDAPDGDICHLHASFHHPFLLFCEVLFLTTKTEQQTPSFILYRYDYISYDNSIKPPINF